jgi:ABC-2 type transport system permease protein
MNTVFLGLELRRLARDYASLFFIAVLPAFLFLIFGTQSYKTESIGVGNVGMLIMISMAAYGAVTATAGIGGMAAVERAQGWGRQLGLTPLRDSSYVVTKTLFALLVACLPVALVYLLGAVTGADGAARAWALSAAIVVAGAAVFGVYGLVVGLAFRTEAAVSAASGVLVVLAFLGNVFIPITGTLLTIGKFTPLYGYVALARYPLTGGESETGTPDVLWQAIANVTVWAVIFLGAAIWLVRRGRERQ